MEEKGSIYAEQENLGSKNYLNKLVIDSSKVVVTNDLSVNSNLMCKTFNISPNEQNIDTIIGKTVINSSKVFFKNYAVFSHIDNSNVFNYALKQKPLGSTHLNAATSENIFLKINNEEKIRLTSDGSFGIGTTSPSSLLDVSGDINCNKIGVSPNEQNIDTIIGKTVINLSGGFNNGAVFSQIDNSNTTNYALLQGTNGSTFLNAASGENITFLINNQNKMMLTSDGKFGIGTNNPSNLLHVDGKINCNRIVVSSDEQNIDTIIGKTVINSLKNGLSNDAVFSHIDNSNVLRYALKQEPLGSTNLNAATSENIFLKINNEEKIRLTSDGSFGIGTTTPSSLLDVDGDINSTGTINVNALQIGGTLITANATELNYLNGVSEGIASDSKALVVNSTRDISNIGTINCGNITAATTIIGNIYNSNNNNATFINSNPNLTNNANKNYGLRQNSSGRTNINSKSGQPINFNINDTTKMVLTSDGSFGIGTTNPQASLHIGGNNRAIIGNVITGYFLNAFGANIAFWGNSDFSSNYITHYALAQDDVIGTTKINSNDKIVFLISNNPNSFIQLTNNAELDMNNNDIINEGSSDDRLKHNEIIINNGLEIIRKLVPQKYKKTKQLLDANYNGDLSNYDWKYESGLIAQDILNIDDLSYVVHGGDYIDESGNNIAHPYGLNYNDIHVYNIAAVKELDTIVQNQDILINQLNTKVQNLESENLVMKSALNELLLLNGKSTI